MTSGFCGGKFDVLLIRESSLYQLLEILRKQDVTIEASAAAGLALLLQMKDTIPQDDTTLIN